MDVNELRKVLLKYLDNGSDYTNILVINKAVLKKLNFKDALAGGMAIRETLQELSREGLVKVCSYNHDRYGITEKGEKWIEDNT